MFLRASSAALCGALLLCPCEGVLERYLRGAGPDDEVVNDFLLSAGVAEEDEEEVEDAAGAPVADTTATEESAVLEAAASTETAALSEGPVTGSPPGQERDLAESAKDDDSVAAETESHVGEEGEARGEAHATSAFEAAAPTKAELTLEQAALEARSPAGQYTMNASFASLLNESWEDDDNGASESVRPVEAAFQNLSAATVLAENWEDDLEDMEEENKTDLVNASAIQSYTRSVAEELLPDDEVFEKTGVEASHTCFDHGHANFLEEDIGRSLVNTSMAATAEELAELATTLRGYCLGEGWHGQMCRKYVQLLRQKSWYHLVRETGAMALFSHLRIFQKAPKVKEFRNSGGLGVSVACRADGGKAHLFYRHVHKSAGLAIKKNLAADADMWWGKATDKDWSDNDRCNQYLEQQNSTSGALLFTFVRDPVEKFVAGYAEMVARRLIPILRNARVGTVEHAMMFLDNVFHGTCDNGNVLLQVQNMFGPACESKFDFIGRLEDFDGDWKALGQEAGCDGGLKWPFDLARKHEKYDFGAEKAMRKALSMHKGKLMRALCFWVLPDVVTFGYTLPPACSDHAVLSQVLASV